jgi:lipopolysaccharide/colanic/teichoic acid biosynthesis glycosyltransferase
MSLVGPRPLTVGEGREIPRFVDRRMLVRPGMTGLWQVSGRSNLSEADRVRLDLFYVANWSMVQDLLIVAKTVRAVLASDGAY